MPPQFTYADFKNDEEAISWVQSKALPHADPSKPDRVHPSNWRLSEYWYYWDAGTKFKKDATLTERNGSSPIYAHPFERRTPWRGEGCVSLLRGRAWGEIGKSLCGEGLSDVSPLLCLLFLIEHDSFGVALCLASAPVFETSRASTDPGLFPVFISGILECPRFISVDRP